MLLLLMASTLAERVERLTEGVDGSHDFAHIRRVVVNALRLCKEEALSPADTRLCIAAAYAHDLDDKKYGGTDGLSRARAVLAEAAEAYTQEEVEAICTIIGGVSFTGERAAAGAGAAGGAPCDRLTACVQDADRLDAIGAHGIARCFCFGGSRSRPLAESVQHFHDKLLLLRDMMKTPAGRRAAEERHAYMLAFLAQLEAESAGSSQST